MKRLTLLAFLLLLGGWSAKAQTAPGQTVGVITATGSTCATAGACVIAPLNNSTGSVGVSIANTFSGTVQFEVTTDNSNWVSVNCFPPSSTTAVTSTTAAGTWTCAVNGMVFFRARASAYSSGIIGVVITPSAAINASSVNGGGGGGGSVQPGAIHTPAVYTAANVVGPTPNCMPPSTNGTYDLLFDITASATTDVSCPQEGLAGTPGLTGSTSSYPFVYSDNAQIVPHDYAGSAVVAYTIPTPTTLGNPDPALSPCNYSVQNDTITPTTFTINKIASILMPSYTCWRISVDPNNATNWLANLSGLGANAVVGVYDAYVYNQGDVCLGIQGALTAAGNVNAIIRTNGYQTGANRPCSVNPLANITGVANVKIDLTGQQINTTAAWSLASNAGDVWIIGGSDHTVLNASTGFPASTPVITIGATGGVNFGVRVEHLYIAPNAISGVTCYLNWNANEGSGLKDVVCSNSEGSGGLAEIQFNCSNSNCGHFDNVNIQCQRSGAADCILFTGSTGVASLGKFDRITCNNTSHTSGLYCLHVVSTAGLISAALSNIHAEGFGSGNVFFDTGSTGSLDTADCTGTCPVTLELSTNLAVHATYIRTGSSEIIKNDTLSNVVSNGTDLYVNSYNQSASTSSLGVQASVDPCQVGCTIGEVGHGTVALGTASIASGACATTVTSATGAGKVVATDQISFSFNSDPTGVVGYQPATTGMLTIITFPTAGNINVDVCNNTLAPITPGAITLNWTARR